MSFFNPTADLNLTGKILIVPVVSAANVSQLAIDLLIASFSLHRIGIFDSKDFVPIIGGREDGEEGITTPFELYGKSGVDLLVIQHRSPVLKWRKQEFVASLVKFIQDSGVASVLFLSGVDPSNRTDAQMFIPTFYVHPSNTPALNSTPLRRLTQLSIPVYSSPVLQRPRSGAEESLIPFIPGGGLSRRILSSLPPSWSVPTALLLQFALEGDNRADANQLAAAVANVLGADNLIKEWRQPNTWKQGLFGTPHDQSLYG